MNSDNLKIESLLMELIEAVTLLSKRPVIFEDFVISRRELHVIALIGQSRGITNTELSKFFGITRAVTHKILTQLEKRNLVYKTSQSMNNKNISLHLTDAGWKVYSLHDKYHKKLSTDFNSYLSEKNASTRLEFIDFLKHILALTQKHL